MGKRRTDQELAAIAAKYSSLKDFFRNDHSAYMAIRKRGLFDKLCGNMKRELRPDLSNGELAEIASKYDNLKEFREKEAKTYAIIGKRGLLRKLCGHMKRSKRDVTDEELATVASNYDSLKEFRDKEPANLQLIHKRNLFDKLCGHMKRDVRKDLSDDDLAAIASSYDVLRDFRKNDPVTYSIISKRGLLDKLCGHMKREMSKYRTDKELAMIASRYTVLKDFREKESSAYNAMQERGLLEKLCDNMEREHKPHVPDEKLAQIASHYTVLKDFRKNENSAYSMICKRGLFKKLCGHMKRGSRDLTDELIADIAVCYQTRKDFMEADSSAYSIACKRGIIDKVCAHMETFSRPMGYWDKERCRERAADYNSKSEFSKGCPSAYGAAQKNGWLDDICSHMIPRGNLFKRKIYVFTFSDGYAYVGLAQDPQDRYRAHIAGRKNSPILPHIKKTGATYEFTILTDWLHKDVAVKVEDDYIKKYAAEGWKMLNKVKGGALGATTSLYTHERIKREVEKYEYVDDLRNGSPQFYKYILRHHLWEEYCSQMKFRRPPRCYWTLERAIAIVSECKYRGELCIKYPQAWKLLKDAGLLDKYYPNNKKRVYKKTWTIEKSLTIISGCSSRMDLSRKHPGAYVTLRDAGLLDQFFPTKWTKPYTEKEKMAIIAICKTRTELHNRNRSVYDWAKKNGLLDKYFPK